MVIHSRLEFFGTRISEVHQQEVQHYYIGRVIKGMYVFRRSNYTYPLREFLSNTPQCVKVSLDPFFFSFETYAHLAEASLGL